MATRFLPPDELVFEQLIRKMLVHSNLEVNGKELIAIINTDKLLKQLSIVAKEYGLAYKAYTGSDKYMHAENIDKITIRVNDYSFSAIESFEERVQLISKGWSYESKDK
jgi:hypothetical protein